MARPAQPAQPALLVSHVESRLQQCYPAEQTRRVLANDAGKSLMHRGELDGDWAWGSASDEWRGLVYGEFPLAFFQDVLTRAEQLREAQSAAPTTPLLRFVDVGSGFGRLVLGAAWLRPRWSSFVGVELLPELHHAAAQALELAKQQSQSPSLDRCSLLRCDMTAPAAAAVLHKADIVFAYASAFPTLDDGLTVELLSNSILAARIKPCTIVATIDGWLNEEHFELLAELQAHNDDNGESATAFFWKMKPRSGG